jgi:hypothetical protein
VDFPQEKGDEIRRGGREGIVTRLSWYRVSEFLISIPMNMKWCRRKQLDKKRVGLSEIIQRLTLRIKLIYNCKRLPSSKKSIFNNWVIFKKQNNCQNRNDIHNPFIKPLLSRSYYT